MNQELTKKLLKEFPWIPRNDPLYRKDMVIAMQFDCDDGWFNLIHDLCAKIHPLVKDEPDFYVMQVKEKFAGLRFYTSFETPEISKLIEEAEAKSYRTCEVCGIKVGVKMRNDGWYKTLCGKCWDKRKKEGEDGLKAFRKMMKQK